MFHPDAERAAESADTRYSESKWGAGPLDRPVSTAESFAAESGDSNGSAGSTGSSAERNPAGLVLMQDMPMQGAQKTTIESPFGSQAQLTELIPDRKKGIQETALIVGDLGYFPKTIFVSQNVPVRMFITGASKDTLCVMVDAFQVRKQVRSQRIEEITFTPSIPGKYRIHCPINQMEATLVVRD